MKTYSSTSHFTKKDSFVSLFITGILLFFILFTLFNDELYHRHIAVVDKVTHVKTEQVTDLFHNKDTVVTDKLQLKITNHKERGQTHIILHSYNKGQTYDTKYNEGDKLFVNLSHPVDITGEKRDTVIAVISSLFIGLLLMIGRKQGIASLITLVINVLVSFSILPVAERFPNIPLILIVFIMMSFCTVITLLCVAGRHQKAYVAMISTISATIVTLLIAQIAIHFTDASGIKYELMSFLTLPPKKIFLTSILIGTLGAIMDVTITIASSLYELKYRHPNISKEAMKKAGRQIGEDIMGPMTNILIFAYLSGSIPMIILYLRNYNPILESFSLHWSLELLRAVTGSIGIVLAIPITIYITVHMLSREVRS